MSDFCIICRLVVSKWKEDLLCDGCSKWNPRICGTGVCNMESATLDFNDLMDTGDEYPGLEIAKSTPLDDNNGVRDEVLHTPEHEPENDYQIKDDNTDWIKETKGDENNGDFLKDKNDFCAVGNNNVSFTEKMDEVPDKNKAEVNQKHVYIEPKADKCEHDETEPLAKKKKFLNIPKSKMESGKTTETDEDNNTDELGNDVNSKTASDTDDVKETKAKAAGEVNGEKEVNEEEPHQQSFLSFLNLKPGMSKGQENDQKAKDDKMENEFYSRKRLRTRKKVSYVEDVPEDDDEEFQIGEDDEEEEESDYRIDVSTSRRRSHNRSHSLRKSAQSSAASHMMTLQSIAPNTQQFTPVFRNVTVPTAPPNIAKIDSELLPAAAKGGPLKGLFECGLCGTFFNTASQFITHQELIHADDKKSGKSGMETFRCEICGFVLTNRFAFLEHKRMKHSKSPINFNCNRCRISFPFLVDFQKHQLTCGTPMCTLCGGKFKSWNEVAEHKAKFHSVVTHLWLSCVVKSCGFQCLTQPEMNQHIRQKHAISELFPCNTPKCSRVFSNREHLNEHKKEFHASEFIVQYQCAECKQCYSTKTLLTEHHYLHTMDKLRKCDLCGRQFSSAWELKNHKEVHVTKGVIKCGTCTRWCLDANMLKTHLCELRKNLGPRVYFCDICHQDFRSDIKMFEHRKEHKNYYQCESCFWECKTDVEYFKHREVHGKFTCRDCCEELPSEKDLEMHVNAHKYYVKNEDMEDNGKQESVMFLCPNLLNVIKV